MTTRGTNFLHQWLASNVPDTVGADIISVSELSHKLFADAKAVGISGGEIEEDTSSVYEAIFDAIFPHDSEVTD